MATLAGMTLFGAHSALQLISTRQKPTGGTIRRRCASEEICQ